MTEVRIQLPLPMDIIGTLLQVIGLTYPGTVLKSDDAKDLWDRHCLVLEIPDEQRHKGPKTAKRYAKAKRHLDEFDGDVADLGPGGITVNPLEYLSKQWAAMLHQVFLENPDAVNYLESKVLMRDGTGAYLVTVCRAASRTPHELRRQAEAERDAAQGDADKFRAVLEQVLAASTIRAARKIAADALGTER